MARKTSSTNRNTDLSETMLIALRRVIRAVDLHSRSLMQSHGLTSPQAMLLREVVLSERLTAGDLARRVSLSQATVTDIVKRLESRGLLQRTRDTDDKRRVLIHATPQGAQVFASAPPLLQETFVERFAALRDWEQTLLLSAVQRVAELMDAAELDASPVLASGEMGGA